MDVEPSARLSKGSDMRRVRASDIPFGESASGSVYDMETEPAQIPAKRSAAPADTPSKKSKPSDPKPAGKTKLTVTNVMYLQIRAALFDHLRKSENGVTQEELVDWYVASKASEDEDSAVQNAQLVRAIIKRLVNKEKLIMSTPVCYLILLSLTSRILLILLLKTKQDFK